MRKLALLLIALLLLAAPQVRSVVVQAPEEKAASAPDQNGSDKKAQGPSPAVAVRNRLVVVGPPKVYDDLYLQNMLSSMQNQLAAIRGIDQATLLSHIGVAQGADLRQMGVAISASGPPTPQTSTFSLAPGVPAFSYPPSYSSPPAAGVTLPSGTAAATTPGTTTTISSVTPTAPTPSPSSLTVPTIPSLGQSSLDTYNESLQLSSAIAGTALLLNGAPSDSVDRTSGQPKTTVTIGFPITVEPPALSDKDLASAVAEVHVTICSNSSEEPPSIVTLLPQERSYNVASMVDKSFLGSASAVLGGVVNVGGGFFWGHTRYYLVQQQETVAFLLPSESVLRSCGDEKARYTSFAWQIRPMLGKEFIRPGNSVNFVRISVPKVDAPTPATPIGKACVSILWRKPALAGLFRHKSDKYLGEEILGEERCNDIDYYGTQAKESTLTVMDIGQGAVTVQVDGTFLPGTTVRLGNTYLKPDSITATHDTLTFTAPASAIVAAGQVYIVGRDGLEVWAVRQVGDKEHLNPTTGLSLKQPKISPYSDTQSLVTLDAQEPVITRSGDNSPPFENRAVDPWVVVIGGKVFGLSDAPFFSEMGGEIELNQESKTYSKRATQIQLIVPTSLIQASPRIELRRLLWPDVFFRQSKSIPADTFSKAAPSVSKASTLSTHKGLTIALLGTGLDRLKPVYPSPTDCKDCKWESTGSTFLKVTLPKPPEEKKDASGKKKDKDKEQAIDPTDGLRQLAFCRKQGGGDDCDSNFPMLIVDVPKLEAAKPSLEDHDPVPVNTHKVTITGSELDQVVSIEHAKVSLAFRIVPGKSPSLELDLPDSIAAVPGGYSLLVTFADKSRVVYLLTIQKSAS
jgi:hypothetical protein